MNDERYILNDAGEPEACPDLITWARWYERAERRIASNYVGDVLVSTVFLGLDHSFGVERGPILFETMIFGGPEDGYQERYRTKDEAIVGHAHALSLVLGIQS